MKIRNGFVSNSSSSSFVVRRHTFETKDVLITDKQQKKLEKFGFRKTMAHHPNDVPAFYNEAAWKSENTRIKDLKEDDIFGYNYGYEITCNQDDVIGYLIKNKISFVGSCHYGHETVIYNAETDVLKTGINYGERMSTYGTEEELELSKTKPITSICLLYTSPSPRD